MSFSKLEIFAAKDRPREFVSIPEWTPEGEVHDPLRHGVWVQTMSAADRDLWEQLVFSRKGKDEAGNALQMRVFTAICSVVDDDGQKLFTEADAGQLREKASGPLSAIFDVAVRLSKLGQKDREELVKN